MRKISALLGAEGEAGMGSSQGERPTPGRGSWGLPVGPVRSRC